MYRADLCGTNLNKERFHVGFLMPAGLCRIESHFQRLIIKKKHNTGCVCHSLGKLKSSVKKTIII